MLCFRPVKAEKKVEPALVIEKLEAVAVDGSPKQFRVEVKNIGAVVGNLVGKVSVRESSTFQDVEVAAVWSPSAIASNGVSSGVVEFNWESGKMYYVKVATNEGTSATLYTRAA